ncbi:alpha/beta hydrolase [Streptomyces sp. NPDC001941]|uniref:alpha/beta hydrolase n=1 Tax=Streptomyces sp. NPDC001941 TaxID=3154659 RepID=UPI00332D63B8
MPSYASRYAPRARSRSRALALALSASAVAATLTAAATPASAAPAPLAWRSCAQEQGPREQECADLSVPLDYRDPGGERVRIAVSRLRSDRPAARRGTLLLLAGGPGSSGVQRLTQKGAALRAATEGAYDIVTLDPRGVGGSTKKGCGIAPADRYMVTLRGWPGPDGEIGENAARGRRVAEACHRNGGALVASYTTANEVRDIESLRRAVGAEKLSAWGTSYGAYVGAVYAQRHPGRTDRWVLDSAGDPDPRRLARGWLANMARGAEDRFPDFAAWAADPARGELRLAERPERVRGLFLDLAARLDRAPRATATAPLTGNTLRQALQLALYGGDGPFTELARLIRDAGDPEATPVLPAALSGPMPDEDAAVTVAGICNDVAMPGDLAAYERAVRADRARHPLTAGMTANVLPCAFWKDVTHEKPVRITGRGPSNVLIVQNLRDPATPYAGAQKLREAFGPRARMVAVDSGGHGSYLGTGNACGNTLVSRFLTEGRRPAGDVLCAADWSGRMN